MMVNVMATPQTRLWCFLGLVLVGLTVAIAFHLTMEQLGFSFPWNTFLFLPGDRFNDWHNSIAAAATLDPYFAPTKAVSAYFPFAYLLMQGVAGYPRNLATLIYLGISCGLLVLAVSLSAQLLRDSAAKAVDLSTLRARPWLLLTLVCLASYPVLFALDRGNLDIWIGCLCAIYVSCLRTRYVGLGLASLAIAVALKGYPIVFLGLSLAERRYRDLLLTPLIAIALSAIGLASLQGDMLHNLQGFIAGLAKYRQLYVLGDNSLFASADPYNALRTLKVFAGLPRSELADWSPHLLKFYEPLALVIAAAAGLCATFVRMPYWRRVMIIGLVAILFPNVANDYKLAVLLPGLFALLFSDEPSAEGKNASAILLVTALLMIPKSYCFYRGIGFSNLANAALLLTLTALVLSGVRPLNGTTTNMAPRPGV